MTSHTSKKLKLASGSKAFVVFPNSLFADHKSLSSYDKVFIVEEPLFFGHDVLRPYNINKIKLAWLRASMKHYFKTIKDKCNAEYVNYSDVKEYEFLKSYSSVSFHDPADFELDTKLTSNGIKFHKLDSPLFILSATEVALYFSPRMNAKKFTQGHFYNWLKERLGVLVNVTSKDSENRLPLPKNHKFKFSTPDFDVDEEHEYYVEAKEYISSHEVFKDNIGNFEKLHLFPISTKSAEKQFMDFIEHRAKDFGPYEDAIDKNQVVLFHSFVRFNLLNAALRSMSGFSLLNGLLIQLCHTENQSPSTPLKALYGK
jgi:deoxyribodipyrimidine photolyase-related protein